VRSVGIVSAATVQICSVMTQPPPEAMRTRCTQPGRPMVVNGSTQINWPMVDDCLDLVTTAGLEFEGWFIKAP
jgi:hypothetical protein